jgi:hypothetical protein
LLMDIYFRQIYDTLKQEFLVHYGNISYLHYRHKHLQKINKI